MDLEPLDVVDKRSHGVLLCLELFELHVQVWVLHLRLQFLVFLSTEILSSVIFSILKKVRQEMRWYTNLDQRFIQLHIKEKEELLTSTYLHIQGSSANSTVRSGTSAWSRRRSRSLSGSRRKSLKSVLAFAGCKTQTCSPTATASRWCLPWSGMGRSGAARWPFDQLRLRSRLSPSGRSRRGYDYPGSF